ncbi:helix-turn-helix transcriptional regulator [Actinocorallia aurantiaca]|uniref:Helix-turn-helix transcriptional regulator n=1 Tax=Actinocorallia aurantiaca TaxID=46204 RepID=A0ABP6GRK0_9ACTN
MYMRENPDPKDSLGTLIAFMLRFYRVRAGETGEQVGRIIGVGKAQVSKLEHARQPIGSVQAATLDRHWKTGGLLAYLVHFSRILQNPAWLDQHFQHEAQALVIRYFNPLVIPGLLQTEQYARALLVAGRVPNVDHALKRRMARKEIMKRSDPPMVRAIIDESVLLRPVLPQGTRLEQLRYLSELSEQRNVSIRVIPVGEPLHPGVDGPIKLVTLPTGEVGFTEVSGWGIVITDPDRVRDLAARYEMVSDHALSVGATRQLLANMIRETESDDRLA